MSKRLHLTVADYAVVALCPALIVLLLSSLVYFVVLCVYHGQYSSRLGYIWFMFILGAVGIARISIEQSRGYATGYAAVLGLATVMVLSRFQTLSGAAAALTPLVNVLLIATVWLLADRITYDCTLIDEDQDASGQGLLDGLSSRTTDISGTVATVATASPAKRRRRGHQPGRTVLWLTAAALPLFGIGQFLLRSDAQLLRSAMVSLALYLFATLSLLVATSFLGIRRYLRQRDVDMPANVSAAWLGGGVLMTAIILTLCFVLPQPGRMLAQLALPAVFESADWLSPSRFGWGNEGAKPSAGDSAPGASRGEADQPAPGSGQPASGHQATGQRDGQQSGGQPEAQGSGEQTGGDQPGGQSSGDQSGGQSSSGQPGGQSSSGQASSETSSGTDNQSSTSNSPPPQSSGSDSSQSPSASQTRDAGSASQQDQSSGERRDSQGANESTSSSSEQQAADSQAAQSASSQSSTPAQPTPSASRSSPLSQYLPSLSGIIKLLIYLVLFAILAVFLWINRAAIADFWRQLLAWLAGRGPAPTVAAATPPPDSFELPPRPFSSFSNPLHSGADPRRAVVETFQAAEAWYREQGQPRKIDETPHEYALRLHGIEAADRQALLRLTDAYNRIVYGGGGASQRDLQSVQAVWQSFKVREPLQA